MKLTQTTRATQPPQEAVAEVQRDQTGTRLADLLSKSAAGDRVAFTEFYDLTAPRVHAVVRRCLIDPSQSEEVTQEIYLEIWQTAASFDASKGEALGWILILARRRAIDRVRSSQASRNRDRVVGIRDRVIDFDPVSEAVEVRLEHERARASMAVLSPVQRQAIESFYMHGLSRKEIADQCGFRVSTINARIRDGLMLMRHQLTVA